MADDADDVPSLIESEKRVPLTVLTGFLGAGKSTLLRWILTERHGYRIAVIMNEFGDTADIEARTINVASADDPTAEGSEEFLELANGCLCCSVKDSGAAAIEKLMLRKGAFDYILLETTGLADPGPIASMFWSNEEYATGLGHDIYLDGVVCVVDAVYGQQQMEEDHAVDGIGESLRQIAGSDVIILNKVDLSSQKQLDDVESIIAQVNPAAMIHRTVRGQVDVNHVVNLGAYAARDVRVSAANKHDHDHDHGEADCDCATHYQVRGISSLLVPCPALDPARLDALDGWLRTVLWEHEVPGIHGHAVEVLRCKGAFRTLSGERYVLQGVREMYELVPVEGVTGAEGPQIGKLVLIGKGMDDRVKKSLEDILR